MADDLLTKEEWRAKEDEQKQIQWEARFKERYPDLNPVTWSSGRGRGGMNLSPNVMTTLDPHTAEGIIHEEFRGFQKRLEDRLKSQETSALPNDLWFEWHIEFQVDPVPQWRRDSELAEAQRGNKKPKK